MFTETPAEPSKDWITLVNTSYWLYQLPFSRLMSAVGTDHILLASIVQDIATYWRCYEILRLQNNVGLFRDSTAAMEHPSVCVQTCCSVTHAAPSRLWQCDSGWYSRLSPSCSRCWMLWPGWSTLVDTNMSFCCFINFTGSALRLPVGCSHIQMCARTGTVVAHRQTSMTSEFRASSSSVISHHIIITCWSHAAFNR